MIPSGAFPLTIMYALEPVHAISCQQSNRFISESGASEFDSFTHSISESQGNGALAFHNA